MTSPKVSIIIPLYIVCDRFFSDLSKFSKLTFKDYEILVVCDTKVKLNFPKARLVLTGQSQTGPAEKRDLALKKAKGSVIAFIDDDAYPDSNWLTNALDILKDPSIAAVGGPGVSPREDSYWEQLTGIVYSSFFCGGGARYRFVQEKRRFVDDFPAYNLLIKTKILKSVGGYGNNFYGGEDTFLCLKLIKLGHKILYDPTVVVYHHRRSLFVPYLKQIANIGKHRGYFARVFPETSRLVGYFVPSVLAFGFFSLLLLSVVSKAALIIFITLFAGFYSLAFFSMWGKGTVLDLLIASFGIISTHLAYGLSFIQGLLTKKLER